MAPRTMNLISDQLKSLALKDQSINAVEVELLGGEITLMPFDFWDDVIKGLKNIKKELNKEKIDLECLFATNGTFKDQRYIELFNSLTEADLFEITTSWEPDTNRFGKSAVLKKRFEENLKKINLRKILLVSMTKGMIQVPLSQCDEVLKSVEADTISFNYIVPSGTALLNDHKDLPSMLDVSNFILSFVKENFRMKGAVIEDCINAMEAGGTGCSPTESSSYAMNIFPDGRTELSATQMGEVAKKPKNALNVEDPHWSTKVIFENSVRLADMLNVLRDECDQCEFYRGCRGGSLYYRPFVGSKLDEDECIGGKKIWQEVAKTDQFISMRGRYIRVLARQSATRKAEKKKVKEQQIGSGYEGFIKGVEGLEGLEGQVVEMTIEAHHGLSLIERIFFYDSLNIPVSIDLEHLALTDISAAEIVVRHQTHLNMSIELVTPDQISTFCKAYPGSKVSRQVLTMNRLITDQHVTRQTFEERSNNITEGLVLDSRNEALFYWCQASLPKENK